MSSRSLWLPHPLDWDRIRRMAVRFARLWCGHASDAEDIAQDALMALLQYRHDLHNLDGYLFVSVKQIALRRIVRQRRMDSLELTTTTTGVGAFETVLLQRALHDCRSLSPRSRLVLEMTLEGYTHTEIASLLGVSRASSRNPSHEHDASSGPPQTEKVVRSARIMSAISG